MSAESLRAKAEAYSSDASALRHVGEVDAALVYELVRDELRRCAEDVEDAARVAWDEGYAAAGLVKIAANLRARNPYIREAS